MDRAADAGERRGAGGNLCRRTPASGGVGVKVASRTAVYGIAGVWREWVIVGGERTYRAQRSKAWMADEESG